jgi:hypothetical protein
MLLHNVTAIKCNGVTFWPSCQSNNFRSGKIFLIAITISGDKPGAITFRSNNFSP